jgi:PleD family two-component response regulator
VGTATFAPDSPQSIDDLLAQADGAMYANKRSQR